MKMRHHTLALSTVAAVVSITAGVVGIGATAYNLSKGTPGSQPAGVSPLYGTGATGSNAGNYTTDVIGSSPAQAINQFDHQDITLPGNTYGSIPERTSAFGALQENTPLVMPATVTPPQVATQAAIQSAQATAAANTVTAPGPVATIGGVSISTIEIVALGAGVLAIGAAIFAHHKSK